MPEFKPYLILFVSVFIIFMLVLAGVVGYLLGSNKASIQQSSVMGQPLRTGSSGQPSPVPAGKCGDGVCGPVETQLGVCPKDCGQTSNKSSDSQNNPLQPQKPIQLTPSFEQDLEQEPNINQ